MIKLKPSAHFSFLPAIMLMIVLGFDPSHTQAGNSSAPSAPEKKAWARFENPAPNLGSRDIMAAIVEAAGKPGYEGQMQQIEHALGMLERMQDLDPKSKTYGNLCWYWHEHKPGDLNAVEFITQNAAILKLRYANHLSPKALESLDRLLKYAVEGIHRHKVDVGYTNIFLMKIWNLLALGEALKRPDLTQEGSGMLDQWIEFTEKNGITEYLSPTYYGTDLDSLGLIVKQLNNPPIQKKAEKFLRLFWEDIAANWFEPAQRLGGAHGRDYDYLTGHGYLDVHLLNAGWITATGKNQQHVPGIIEDAITWTPPAEIHQQALGGIPRFVYQKTGIADTEWASQQLGHHYSIGVSGSCKGPEDKPFAINLAGPQGAQTVMVNFFMDGRDDPYGSRKIPTGASGHNKAHHLVPTFRAVQSGSDVLFLSFWPQPTSHPSKETPPACLYSHMDLPEEAVVWSANQPFDGKLTSQMLPGNICFLRLGDVAVGIRFLLALDTVGRPVSVELANDGHNFHAKRLTVAHSKGAPGEGRGIVAVAVRAEEGLDDAGFATFRKNFLDAKTSASSQGSMVCASAAGKKNILTLNVSLSDGNVLKSQGSDPAMQIAPMSVNGVALR